MTITDNDDLLVEILLWLPAKSLIRFKSVCKRWFILISTQHFSDQHTLQQRHHRLRSKPTPSLLLHLSEVSGYLYLPIIPNCRELVPYGFCSTLIEPTIRSFSNGLFLLQCRNVENPFEVCRVYNPATKNSRKILLNVNHMYRCVVGLNLVFDPLESPHYKIICVKSSPRRLPGFSRSLWRHCQIEVYESNSKTWKVCVEQFMAPRNLSFDHGVELGGRIHWCGGLFFDLQECVVGKLPEVIVPGDDGTEGFYHNYVESNGYLHNIVNCPQKNFFMVFEMQSDYSQWSLKYHGNLDEQIAVVSVVRGESEEQSMLVLHEFGVIKFYAMKESCVKQVFDFGGKEFCEEGRVQLASNFVFQVVETLASV